MFILSKTPNNLLIFKTNLFPNIFIYHICTTCVSVCASKMMALLKFVYETKIKQSKEKKINICCVLCVFRETRRRMVLRIWQRPAITLKYKQSTST